MLIGRRTKPYYMCWYGSPEFGLMPRHQARYYWHKMTSRDLDLSYAISFLCLASYHHSCDAFWENLRLPGGSTHAHGWSLVLLYHRVHYIVRVRPPRLRQTNDDRASFFLAMSLFLPKTRRNILNCIPTVCSTASATAQRTASFQLMTWMTAHAGYCGVFCQKCARRLSFAPRAPRRGNA